MPLVIARPADPPPLDPRFAAELVRSFRRGVDYQVHAHEHGVSLTDAGVSNLEARLRCSNLYAPENQPLLDLDLPPLGQPAGPLLRSVDPADRDRDRGKTYFASISTWESSWKRRTIRSAVLGAIWKTYSVPSALITSGFPPMWRPWLGRATTRSIFA